MSDGDEAKLAGELWIAFGCLSVICGAAGSILAIYERFRGKKEIAGMLLILAGTLGVASVACAYLEGGCSDSRLHEVTGNDLDKVGEDGRFKPAESV